MDTTVPEPTHGSPSGPSDDSDLVMAQMLMTNVQMHQLNQMAQQLKLDTADTVNTALSLLGWAMAEQARGRIVGSIDEASGTYLELDFSSPRSAQSLN